MGDANPQYYRTPVMMPKPEPHHGSNRGESVPPADSLVGDVVERPASEKAMCFRLLYTLHESALLEKVGDNQYRCLIPLRQVRSTASVMPIPEILPSA